MRLSGLKTIKTRREFVYSSNNGLFAGSKSLFLQAVRCGNFEDGTESGVLCPVKVGFTVGKKVGNAVTRNKVKRRFRAVAQNVIPSHGRNDYSYVIIGRQRTEKTPFKDLHRDLIYCLKILRLYKP